MLIIENPIFLLIIALAILSFFLILFKLLNYFDSRKQKTQKTENKKEENVAQVEDKKEEYIEPNTNYLYDRFVTEPTDDDAMSIDENICDAFLKDDDYLEIRNHKVDIKVEKSDDKSELYKRIEQITNNNRIEKEKLLDEFNGLSREMKLLLIENILQKME